jgi:Tn3 transposase DDE domain
LGRASIGLRHVDRNECHPIISVTRQGTSRQAATNKSEAFNRFVQRRFFGGEGLIAENDRNWQRKLIKYNRLIANSVIFHNVPAHTRAIRVMAFRLPLALSFLGAVPIVRVEDLHRQRGKRGRGKSALAPLRAIITAARE